MKAFKAPQRGVKKKFNLIFISIQLPEMHGAGRVNIIIPLFGKAQFIQK